MEPYELLEVVVDEASFIAFVKALLLDAKANSEEWENGTIEQFLDGALAWAEATNVGATQGLVSASPWRRVATFLYCGKIYE